LSSKSLSSDRRGYIGEDVSNILELHYWFTREEPDLTDFQGTGTLRYLTRESRKVHEEPVEGETNFSGG